MLVTFYKVNRALVWTCEFCVFPGDMLLVHLKETLEGVRKGKLEALYWFCPLTYS